MRRWALLLGSFLIFIGVVSLAEAIWKIDLGKFFWPILLIVIGAIMLIKPPMPWWLSWKTRFEDDFPRHVGVYTKDETLNGFIGDTVLDLSQMILPDGETHYRLNGFVGDVKIRTTDEIGVKVRSSSFVGNLKFFGGVNTGIMSPVEDQTSNFDTAVKKVVVDVNYFVCDVKVKKV
jgi:lia operon protein LiaF